MGWLVAIPGSGRGRPNIVPVDFVVDALLSPGNWDDGDPQLRGVPALGQHTDAILAELGLDTAAIAALRAAEAI